MAGENQSGMQCVEVEALLAEALDGTLQGSQLAAFEAHQQGCASCRSMVEEARAGMHWLQGAGRSRAAAQPGPQHPGPDHRSAAVGARHTGSADAARVGSTS